MPKVGPELQIVRQTRYILMLTMQVVYKVHFNVFMELAIASECLVWVVTVWFKALLNSFD